MKEYTQKFDAVVVGAGPAGASSAIIFGILWDGKTNSPLVKVKKFL